VRESEKIQKVKDLAWAAKTLRSLGAPDCPTRQASVWSTGCSREFVGGVRLKFTGLSGGAPDYPVSQRSAEPTVVRAIRAWRVAEPTVWWGHRTVRCTPDSVRCTNGSKSSTVGCANLGKQSALDTEQCLSGGTPDYLVRHPTQRKNCLPGLLSTAPSCLGAIKGTPRRMEEYTKHTLNILRLPHSILAHSIDILSDLSSILVANLLCFIWAQVLACVCVYCWDLCVLLPSLTLVLSLWYLLLGRETPTCGDSSQTGNVIRKRNTVVFKLIIGSLERGWVQPSSIGTPQRGVGKFCTWPNHGINHCVYCVVSLCGFCVSQVLLSSYLILLH
jgi:hypothetical protein